MSREKEAAMNNQGQAEVLTNHDPVTTGALLAEGEAFSEEQQYRAGAYGLLATILRVEPDGETLARVAGFSQITTSLLGAKILSFYVLRRSWRAASMDTGTASKPNRSSCLFLLCRSKVTLIR